jgi:HSP20 family protein
MLTLNAPKTLGSFKHEMDRLFERFLDLERPDFGFLGEWTPWMDMFEAKNEFIVKAEVPGIEPKDIQIVLQDQVLTIRGEKREEKEEKAEKYYRSERAHGLFERSVRLPSPVLKDKVHATFKHGLLTVTMTKAPGEKGLQIPVKVE